MSTKAKPEWMKMSEEWPDFTTSDIAVRGPGFKGERKVKFMAAMFPHLPMPDKFARFGFMFSDCIHPMQNTVVPMEGLEWKTLSEEMNGSPDGAINATRNTATSYGGLFRHICPNCGCSFSETILSEK